MPRKLSEIKFLENDWLVSESAWSVVVSFYNHIPSLGFGGGPMNGLNYQYSTTTFYKRCDKKEDISNFLLTLTLGHC